MAVTTATRVMIWGSAGRTCSHPKCGKVLISETEGGNRSLIGEIAHIISPKPDGPRHSDRIPADQLDAFNNLILLCQEHHKIIDDHPSEFSIELMRKWKAEHEFSVAQRLSDTDKQELAVRARYGDYVDYWAEAIELKEWREWTSSMFGADIPRMTVKRFERLRKLLEWLLSRVWPGHLPALEAEFTNFRLVLSDLLTLFGKHARERHDEMWTEKFYKIPQYNPELYDRLFREWLFHSKLVQDLTLELTCSANRVCDLVRQHIQSDFMLKEGVLLITAGMDMNLQHTTYRVEYKSGETYPGLERFKIEREQRHVSFGLGTGPEDKRFREAFDC